jgi:hypothetical protein
MPQRITYYNEELGGNLLPVLQLAWLEAIDTHEDVAGGVIHRSS